MQAESLFQDNFRVAESLIHLYEVFRDMKEAAPREGLHKEICACFERPESSRIYHLRNDQVALFATAVLQILSSFKTEGGLNFLLRQAVVVASTALDAFYFDVVREAALDIVKAGVWKKHSRFRKMTFTLEELVSVEGYSDPDFRYKQLLEKNYERGSLANVDSITELADLFGVEKFWDKVVRGKNATELRDLVRDLGERRNRIAHRADRPKDGEESDADGLRPIDFEWTYIHVHGVKPLVTGSARLFKQRLEVMRRDIELEEEQRISRQLLEQAGSQAQPPDPGQGQTPAAP
jgi:hypothetical protein